MSHSARARALFQRHVLGRTWLCFIVLGIAFLGFGFFTVSLATLLKANIDLVVDNGWQALADGAARQFVELLLNGYLAMLFYVVFKTCEYRIVHRLGDGH